VAQVPAKTVPLVLIQQEITAVYAHRDTPEGIVRPVGKLSLCFVMCFRDSVKQVNLVIGILNVSSLIMPTSVHTR